MFDYTATLKIFFQVILKTELKSRKNFLFLVFSNKQKIQKSYEIKSFCFLSLLISSFALHFYPSHSHFLLLLLPHPSKFSLKIFLRKLRQEVVIENFTNKCQKCDQKANNENKKERRNLRKIKINLFFFK